MLTREEKAILELCNRERAKKKLPPLEPNAELTEAARKHSTKMARRNKLSHKLDGKTVAERVRDAGGRQVWLGENIAVGARSPGEVVTVWMKSRGHRENILDKHYTEIGIGIHIGQRGRKFYTQVFAAPYQQIGRNRPDR